MQCLGRTIIAAMTCLTIFWCAGLIGFNVHIKGQPRINNDVRTEAIVVLTGGPDRINTGLDLLEGKRARYLFISGVNTKVSVDQLVSMWKPDVRRQPCCIILGHEAQNTFENASEARDWIAVNKIGSVRLLTTDYHMPRALMEFEAVLPDMEIQPHALTSNKNNWLLIVNEYNKMLFTMIRLKLGHTA